MDSKLIEDAKEALFLSNWRLQMTIPSILAEGETFSLRMTLFGPDSMPASAPQHEFILEDCPGIRGLPEKVCFDLDSEGQVIVPDLKADKVGTTFITAALETRNDTIRVRSNPSWVFQDPPYRIFWGDMHVHTTFSNCNAWACKDPEFHYVYARDLSHLDFAAAADHLRGIASESYRWLRLQELVEKYNSPGQFVPFLAFESSHKAGFGGDNNAYYLEQEGPYFWLDRGDMKGTAPAVKLQELWDFLDGTDNTYMTIPHHTGRAGKYRDFSDPVYSSERERLFEIYSGWGSSEKKNSRYPLRAGNTDQSCYFHDALQEGCRYGVIASSDMHTSMPGSETPWRFPLAHQQLGWHDHQGLAAVFADDLSRESLWEGLWNRRCYATTYVRSLMDVSLGDASMGESLPLSKDDPLRKSRKIKVRYSSAEPGDVKVTLVRNCRNIDSVVWDGTTQAFEFKDDDNFEDICIRGAQFHPDPFVVYYIRAEHPQGQTQWSSPIWLDLC